MKRAISSLQGVLELTGCSMSRVDLKYDLGVPRGQRMDVGSSYFRYLALLYVSDPCFRH